VSRPDAALSAELAELDAAEARARRATFAVAELEEALDEGEASRGELEAALARLEAAEAWLAELRRKRALGMGG
jgi:hypothetical protein